MTITSVHLTRWRARCMQIGAVTLIGTLGSMSVLFGAALLLLLLPSEPHPWRTALELLQGLALLVAVSGTVLMLGCGAVWAVLTVLLRRRT